MKRSLISAAAATGALLLLAPSAFALQSQSEFKKLAFVLLDDAAGKLKEGKAEDQPFVMAECVTLRANILRKFPRPPEDLVGRYNEVCRAVLTKKGDIPASDAVAVMKKYAEKIADMSAMMGIGPLGHPYQGSKKEIEQLIAARDAETEASDLVGAFAIVIPRYDKDDDLPNGTAASADAVNVTRVQLWDLIWGSTYAEAIIDAKVIPQLVKSIESGAELAKNNPKERFQLLQAADQVDEALALLKAAKPDSDEVKKGEEALNEIHTQLDKLYAETVAEQRMAADRYKGADRAKLEGIVRAAITARKQKALRIIIHGDGWTKPETQAWWDEDGKLHWSRSKRLVKGEVAVDTGEKGLQRYKVLPFSFSRQWDYEAGSFLPPRVTLDYWGPPILKKNISK